MAIQNKKMSLDVSARLRYQQEKEVKICELVKTFLNYLKSNIYIHAKRPDEPAKTDSRKLNKGRSKFFTVRDEHKIIRTMLILRETLSSFSIKQLKLKSSVDPHVSENTSIRILKHNMYH